VLEDYTELMEDDMGWYEPKVMTEEMKTILKVMRAHPKLVKPVHRLESVVAALFLLTRAVEAPRRQIRMARRMKVIYGFGMRPATALGHPSIFPSEKRFGEVACGTVQWSKSTIRFFSNWQI
jgi:hypothetical protein